MVGFFLWSRVIYHGRKIRSASMGKLGEGFFRKMGKARMRLDKARMFIE
jgi:hypothetical protein